ncbi:carbohydrate ABC transporter permease [Carboxydochorda subterranea]|uniref:Carbohydrate ABC transporter permease n=1 Tax=Carboxydichorda subterranea TaxID=3109565 RepID=A0ABZ1BV73_9FIRM|nr:carbohydrate ABC transporter permease [Limnochorda sp. L945t]WRP16027.1 carbohydrate ABC transporter permease [Limnochorda sp. L945t]
MRVRRRLVCAAAYAVLTLGGVVVLFPFFWMLITSFKPFDEIFALSFWPSRPTLDNYLQVLTATRFPRWYLNSLVVATATTASVLFFDSLVGYTLAKLRFPGRDLVFVLILSTLMIPTEMLVIPWFVTSSERGWVDTYWGIAFPGLMSAFGVFLMRQFFETLPDDLLDAGRIDGVSEFGLFRRIALPLVRPAMSALAILTFLGNWNAFLWPLIIIQSDAMRTLPVGMALFSGEAGSAWNLIMAASGLAIVPVIVVFGIFQRQIIEGVVLTGVKG